jgi:hypothetical protein
MRAVRTSLGAEYQLVGSVVGSCYGGIGGIDAADWLDRIETWAQAFRERQTKPGPRKAA